jgi:hypothetical protein
VWQFAQGVEIGPCGLVTLARGAFTPTPTPDPALGFPEGLGLELLLDLAAELAPELEPEFAPESFAVLTLAATPFPGDVNAAPPSIGASPRTIVMTQRETAIVSPCDRFAHINRHTKNDADGRAQKPRLPAFH